MLLIDSIGVILQNVWLCDCDLLVYPVPCLRVKPSFISSQFSLDHWVLDYLFLKFILKLCQVYCQSISLFYIARLIYLRCLNRSVNTLVRLLLSKLFLVYLFRFNDAAVVDSSLHRRQNSQSLSAIYIFICRFISVLDFERIWLKIFLISYVRYIKTLIK